MRSALPVAMAAVALSLAGTAAAAREAPKPKGETIRIVIPVVNPGCDKPEPGGDTVLVCGRDDKRYRLDPAILAVSRALEAKGGPPRRDGRLGLYQEKCSPVGSFGCRGQDVVPISAIAITAVTALTKVAKGESLRPMLRPGATDYELYQMAKADEEARKLEALERPEKPEPPETPERP